MEITKAEHETCQLWEMWHVDNAPNKEGCRYVNTSGAGGAAIITVRADKQQQINNNKPVLRSPLGAYLLVWLNAWLLSGAGPAAAATSLYFGCASNQRRRKLSALPAGHTTTSMTTITKTCTPPAQEALSLSHTHTQCGTQPLVCRDKRRLCLY